MPKYFLPSANLDHEGRSGIAGQFISPRVWHMRVSLNTQDLLRQVSKTALELKIVLAIRMSTSGAGVVDLEAAPKMEKTKSL